MSDKRDSICLDGYQDRRDAYAPLGPETRNEQWEHVRETLNLLADEQREIRERMAKIAAIDSGIERIYMRQQEEAKLVHHRLDQLCDQLQIVHDWIETDMSKYWKLKYRGVVVKKRKKGKR